MSSQPGLGFVDAIVAARLGGRVMATAPLLVTSSRTITVPARAVGAYIRLWGGGGSGALANNVSLGSARGGAGGGYSEGYVDCVPGESAVITIGAGGAAVSSGGAGAFSGNAGSSTSFAVVAKMISATGGGGGAASTTNGVNPSAPTAGVGSNGDINSSGGISGTCTAATGNYNATGGASAGNALGAGASSGAASGRGASGGAGIFGASGDVSPSTAGASGGGG